MFPGSDAVHVSWAGPKGYVLDEIKFYSFLTGMWSLALSSLNLHLFLCLLEQQNAVEVIFWNF